MRPSTLLRLFILLLLVACSSNDDDGGVIMTGVERDMQVVDRGVILADVSVMTQDSAVVADQGATEPDDAGVEMDVSIDEGVVVDMLVRPVDGSVTPEDAGGEPEPPMCGNAGPACEEACRWLADCALAGACELDDTDRPLLLEMMCQRTCENTPAYGESSFAGITAVNKPLCWHVMTRRSRPSVAVKHHLKCSTPSSSNALNSIGVLGCVKVIRHA